MMSVNFSLLIFKYREEGEEIFFFLRILKILEIVIFPIEIAKILRKRLNYSIGAYFAQDFA